MNERPALFGFNGLGIIFVEIIWYWKLGALWQRWGCLLYFRYFYLVIHARVLCSSLGGYMRSYGTDSHDEGSKGIKDCRAAREIDSKLEGVS